MIMESLRAWLIANVAAVDALDDAKKVYVGQAEQGTRDHVLLTTMDNEFHNVLNPDDELAERTTQVDLDVKCSTAKRAAMVANAIVAALKNFTGTMGDRVVLSLDFTDERDGTEQARTGQVRGRSVVELELTIHHTAAA